MASITIQTPPAEGTAGALPGRSLSANFAWTTAGNSIGAAAQWGVIVLLARLGNPAIVGQYALGLAIASPAFVFAGLNLRTVQATDVRGDFDFGDYLTLRLLGMACAFVAVVGILGWSGFRTETTVVILAVALTKAFESLSDVCYGRHQQH